MGDAPDQNSAGQIPAPCRPLMRQRGKTCGSEAHEASNIPRSRSSSESLVTAYRSRSQDSIIHSGPSAPQAPVPEKKVTVPASNRPSQPPRRVSEKVLKDTKSLRSELEQLRQQLSDGEVARQRELLIVNFTVNRIFEVQKNQMEVQSKLVDRFNEMEIRPEDQTATSNSDRGSWHRQTRHKAHDREDNADQKSGSKTSRSKSQCKQQ